MGDAMDKHCLQNPLDVVEGVTHAGQAATRHVALHTDYILCCDYYTASPHCCHTPQVFGMMAGLSAQRLELCGMATEPPENTGQADTHCTTQCLLLVKSYLGE